MIDYPESEEKAQSVDGSMTEVVYPQLNEHCERVFDDWTAEDRPG
jgi:hypothetical protein